MKTTSPSYSFLPEIKDQVFQQAYPPAVKIEGSELINLRQFPADEGDFSELLRITEKGDLEAHPGFFLKQINRTELFPHSIKAWHVHQKQDEIWYEPPTFHIVVGLWDLRKDSPTANQKQKIILGCGRSQMLYIPKGVAHGSVNHSPESIQLFYFVNQSFNLNEPDEFRLHWDTAGADFWAPERD